MDREVIQQKLGTLRSALPCAAVSNASQTNVRSPPKRWREIPISRISLRLTLPGPCVCVDIGAHLIAGMEVPPPDTMGQTFDALAQAGVINEGLAMQLKKAVGFRNIAVHNYEEIDWAIVHAIASHHLGDFAEFAKVMASRLEG